MCGIAGIVGSRPVNPSTVLNMTDLLSHRGPDGQGLWSSDDKLITFGHRRLSVIDTSKGGHQPMQKGQLVITYNGEIYNYLEIKERLKSLGVTFYSQSDTEVLINAYQYWGEECLNELNGMFAFAIYDGENNKLFCARDRFGEKPFLFTFGNDFFAFASEYKSLLCLDHVGDDYDQIRLLRFLHDPSSGLDDNQETLFSSISQLMPAHYLSLDLDKFSYKIRKYWEFAPIKEYSKLDQRDANSLFREILTDSVRLRMRSDVTVGSCLSGGLDSSSIVCIVKALTHPNENYLTFTGRFPNTGADEWQWAKEIIDQHNLENHVTEPTAPNFVDELEDFIWYNELPVGSTSQYAQWCVFRLARQNNVTVLLDGQGGDELLAGYEQYFRSYLASIKPLLTPKEFKEEISEIRTNYPLALPSTLQDLQYFLPQKIKHAAARLAGAGSDFLFGLKTDVARNIDTNPMQDFVPPENLNPLTTALWKDSLHTNLQVLLRYGDRNSMAHSREVRLPFCDHRIPELTLSLGAPLLMGEAQTKRVLRGAMEGILPETIRQRRNKQGFLPPQAAWFRKSLRNLVEEVIESTTFQNDGIWQITWWRTLLARFDSGEDHLAHMLWRPLIYDAWKRNFLNRVTKQRKFQIFQVSN